MASKVMPAVEQVLHMNGGDEETSYANNSSLQVRSILLFKDINFVLLIYSYKFRKHDAQYI